MKRKIALVLVFVLLSQVLSSCASVEPSCVVKLSEDKMTLTVELINSKDDDYEWKYYSTNNDAFVKERQTVSAVTFNNAEKIVYTFKSINAASYFTVYFVYASDLTESGTSIIHKYSLQTWKDSTFTISSESSGKELFEEVKKLA